MEPLWSLLRPKTLEDFVGQPHLIWENKPIKSFLHHGQIPSMIFWWPPWCGKTTLAHIIANSLQGDFIQLSWVTSKKDDLKDIIEQAQTNLQYKKNTIVFLDEIHRRNKAQQDSLLPYVEKWIITLIWATTENPSFTINNALLSRSRIFVFEKLSEQEIASFIKTNQEKIKQKYPEIELNEENISLVSKLGNGDLRNSLNILESALIQKKSWILTDSDILQAGQKPLYYDRNWEEHYNIISAVHKSLRDSDPDAACYRVQRMLVWWEDPLYVARRLLRFASEDIGLADNNALLLANQVYDSVAKIGMPECDVFLIQLTVYLAKAPKSNQAYKISIQTKQDIQKFWNLPVPMHIRNAPTKMMEDLWYGKDYKYAHDYKDAKVDQEHFPPELKWRRYL